MTSHPHSQQTDPAGYKSILWAIEGDSLPKQWVRAHLDYAHDGWCLIWPFSRTTNDFPSIGKPAVRVHRLMCEYRNGPAPTAAHQAAHSCGRGHDACVNPMHLRWRTNSENQLERYQHSGPTQRAKLTPDQVDEIRALKGRATTADIAKQFGVTENNIDLIHAGKTWKNTSSLVRRVFTADEVRLIRSASRTITTAQFAAQFDVSPRTIQHIREGSTYKWVQP